MRKTLWIIPLLFAAIGAPSAHADSFWTITFYGPDAPTVIGPNAIEYDPGIGPQISTGTFVTPSFTVLYEGSTITLFSVGFPPPYCFCSPSPNDVFALVASGTSMSVNDLSEGFPVYSSDGGGPGGPLTWNVILTPIPAVPEPGTGGLMLLGVGAVLVMRRRLGQGHLQSTWTHH